MLSNIYWLPPFIICFFWAIHFFSRKKKNSKSQKIVVSILDYTIVRLLRFRRRNKYSDKNGKQNPNHGVSEAIKNSNSLSDSAITEESDKEEAQEKIKTVRYTKLIRSFQKLIEEEKVFLQSNLRMDELAASLCTNRTYISRMIKEEYQCSFSDYINRKRIEHSQMLMCKNSQMKQHELAEKSGFLSVTSYNRTFKQMVGIPPKEWLKNQKFN